MGKKGIIETHHLEDRIAKLSVDDGKKDYQIAQILTADGFKISQPTVSRWLNKQKEKAAGKSQTIFEEHVAKELPKDLEALEEMEGQCLDWSREEIADKVKRISTWVRVEAALDDVIHLIYNAVGDEKAKRNAAKDLVTMCLGWIMTDRRDQRDRISAMRMAGTIIEIKLRHAGVIDAAGSGNIIIKTQTEEYPPGTEQGPDKGMRLHLVGGPDNAK